MARGRRQIPTSSSEAADDGPLLHSHVTVVEVADPMLLVELKADPRLANLIVAELSDRVAVVRPGAADFLLKTLRKGGHTPKVLG
jgi:hypothetical protein